jgi:phosphoribosylanthranilate isomerase
MTVRVKICGITRSEDARVAAQLGADYLGLICAPSPRRIDPNKIGWLDEVRDEYPNVEWVGVFVNPDPVEMAEVVERVQFDLLQIHVSDPSSVQLDRPWIWATHAEELARRLDHFESSGAFGVLLDTPDPARAGGTGKSFDWRSIGTLSSEARLFLAGGLGPDNVLEAIAITRPFAVDASSRLEQSPGKKDPARLAQFFAAIARAGEQEDPE